jgi:hypothetical protein
VSMAYERQLVLVRPDGHVAWRSDDEPNNPEAIINAIRGEGASVAHPEQPFQSDFGNDGVATSTKNVQGKTKSSARVSSAD